VSRLTRRQLLARGAGAAVGTAIAGSGLAAGATDARARPAADAAGAPPGSDAVQSYLAFMDAVVARIHSQWSESHSAYRPLGGTYATVVNARMLQVHAGAALAAHTGASRDDERARRLVATLLSSPAPFRTGGADVRGDKMFHLPGWITSLTDPEAVMDKAVDPQVAQALVAAWRAGSTLQLDAATLQQIVQAVASTARCAFFRYPGIRLNQLNWNCALYALDAELTGATDLLRGDYREQMLRFATFATRPAHRGGTPNLGPGWHFSYLPNHDPASEANLDSAEYANETLDCVRHYPAALAAGMAPLPVAALQIFRAYAQRTLYGDWTHSGYLNWDTGLGSQRRYIGKVMAFAQQGLLAIATTPIVQSTPAMGAHARWLFDRGLDLYLRWLSEQADGTAPPPVQFGDHAHALGPDDRMLFAARMASNAAQAIALDLASVAGAQPPPMYSFDPDTQRLAVSTPRYSTAILVHNRHAVNYGGLDLNRLFDSRQQPAGCTAGTGLANFMARIRDPGGKVLLSTQMGDGASTSVAVIERDSSTRRAGPASAPYPLQAYAGPMRSVLATGRIARGAAAIATSHRLLAETIELNWELVLPPRTRWEVALPSYGPEARFLVAGSRSPAADAGSSAASAGSSTELKKGAAAPALAAVREIVVRSQQGGYTITPLAAPPGARMRVVGAPSGTGAALPGPTLVLAGGPAGSRARRLRVSMRLRVHPPSSQSPAEP
jgi:hypothetical protein